MTDLLPVIYDTLVTEWQDTADSLTHEQQEHNAIYVTRFLSQTSASKSCILGLIANMVAESTMNPRKIERHYTNGVIDGFGNGGGLIQWTPYSRIDNIVAVSPYGGSWQDGGRALMDSELWCVACGLNLLTDATGTYTENWSGSPPSNLVAEFGEPMHVDEFTALNVGDTYHGGQADAKTFVWSYMAKRLVPAIVRDGDVTACYNRINSMLGAWNRLEATVNNVYGTSYAYWLLWYLSKRGWKI